MRALKGRETTTERRDDMKEFAERVMTIARKCSPHIKGRVAIADVYDAYGRPYPDAGSMKSFKERLVAAAKARYLDLGRLDMPERMNREKRERSTTMWDRDEVHLIVTEWC
jgi:hypothetical protein